MLQPSHNLLWEYESTYEGRLDPSDHGRVSGGGNLPPNILSLRDPHNHRGVAELEKFSISEWFKIREIGGTTNFTNFEYV